MEAKKVFDVAVDLLDVLYTLSRLDDSCGRYVGGDIHLAKPS